jgi:hypothetical protein
MSDPVVFEAQYILLKIEDVADSGDFNHDCMINLDRSISITKSMVEEVLYDCTDPTKPGTVYRLVDSVSLSASGSGKTHKTSLLAFIQWALSTLSKRAMIELGGVGGAVIKTSVHLTEFTPAGGAPKKYAEASVSFASTGAITVEAL